MHVSGEDKSGMICRCPRHLSVATWQTHTHSLVSELEPSSTASLVTRRCGSLPSRDAQKNVLWNLRDTRSNRSARCPDSGCDELAALKQSPAAFKAHCLMLITSKKRFPADDTVWIFQHWGFPSHK